MKAFDECSVSNSGSIFSKSEKNKAFVLQSDVEFVCEIVDIDGCLLKKHEIRKCDWLFLVPNVDKVIKRPKAYYVELKGINIDDACEQLFNAIDNTKKNIPNYDIEARVVSVKGAQPEILNSENYRKVKRLIKKNIEFCKVHKGNRFTHVETLK
jgi:hypothetical protein